RLVRQVRRLSLVQLFNLLLSDFAVCNILKVIYLWFVVSAERNNASNTDTVPGRATTENCGSESGPVSGADAATTTDGDSGTGTEETQDHSAVGDV
ncbi:hypothetical protein LSAT2_010267, partial [Lamellibrachia satsuma]